MSSNPPKSPVVNPQPGTQFAHPASSPVSNAPVQEPVNPVPATGTGTSTGIVNPSPVAQKQAEIAKVAATSPATAAKTYYSRIDGCCYYLSNGHTCRFEGGEYVTDREFEIKELDELVKTPGQYLISDKPMDVKKSDALIMKEVSAKPGGSGIMNSQDISRMTRG